jgi:hypothetical protein
MRVLFAALLAVAVAVTPAQAEEARKFSQAELDQALAPIALYPDALLSQVLMAATYPLEIVEAARWSKAHPGIQGDEAVRAVQDKDWDPSVKSLVAFPNLLARMDENLEWTRRLGDAFLAQEAQVMDTIQALRQRAKAEGKLQSDERQRVRADGSTIVIEQANPQVVYVPYYDPYVVYGPWWWPGYPPYYWAPWPGYVVGYPGFWWGVGVGVTAGFFFGGFAWHHHHVAVVYPGAYYARPVAAYYRPYGYPPKQLNAGKWQHDKWHRRGVGERYETRRASAMPPAGFRASGDHRGYEGRGEPRSDRRRADAARSQPGGDAQRRQPRFETPRAQPRSEGSRAQPRAETPRALPRFEAPRAQPRAAAPSAPTPPEAPRAQPRVEASHAMPRMDARGGDFGRSQGGGSARGWGGGEFRGGSAGGAYRGGGSGGGGYGGGRGRG